MGKQLFTEEIISAIQNENIIALIRTSYEDDNHVIADSISDWSEVNDQQYALLSANAYIYNYSIIERVDTNPDVVPLLIKDILEKIEAEDKRREQQNKKAAAKKQQNQEKRERKLLEQLQGKYLAK